MMLSVEICANEDPRPLPGPRYIMHTQYPCSNSSTQRLQSVIGIADTQSNTLMGGTPLMFASVMGQTDIVKWLLEVGCDINAQDENNKLVFKYCD